MAERKKDKKTFQDIAEETSNPIIKEMATEVVKQEFAGDEVAQKMIQLTQIMSAMKGGSDIDEDQVKQIIRAQIEDEKISIDNLDDTVRAMIEGGKKSQSVTFIVKTDIGGKTSTKTVTKDLESGADRPYMQKIFSDVLARNNVYLYGGAGTGKTFSAGVIKRTLGWQLIEVGCNQFTSPLELVGGQTIDGYQEGKVTRAWGNINEDGTPMTEGGCVLLLDELPKIDPNTAGILNSALAKIGEFEEKKNPDGTKEIVGASIENGKGEKIYRKNVFIMATGNALLNMKDPEYEANFKQDLSLQDRFVGSTYNVVVDVEYEWEGILEYKWAFIFIYLNKLRNEIFDQGFQAKAFVSIRIMQSVQKTYNVYRDIISRTKKTTVIKANPDISFTPAPIPFAFNPIDKTHVKTIINSIDEFFSLFTLDQAEDLRTKTDYDGFKAIVEEKNNIPDLARLNTPEELKEVAKIIKKAKANNPY